MTALKVNLYGVVGHNFGDEAIAVAARQEIVAHVPHAHVSVASSARRGLFELYQIDELRNHRKSLSGIRALIRGIRDSDFVLIGGGTLIQDKLGLTLLRGNLAYALQVTLLAKLFGKPVGTLAIGVDELRSHLGPILARWFIRLTDVLLVRDEQSLSLVRRLFEDSQVADSSWLVGADPAFLIEVDESLPLRDVHFKDYLLLSLVNEGIDWKPFLSVFANSVQRLLESGVIDGVVLLAMDDRPSEELSIFERFRQEYPQFRSVSQVVVPRDVYDAARVIRGAKIMTAARLHAMILGLGKVPFLGISRTTKTDNFLEYARAIGIDVGSAVNSEELTAMLFHLVEDREALEAQTRTLQALKGKARLGIGQLVKQLMELSTSARYG